MSKALSVTVIVNQKILDRFVEKFTSWTGREPTTKDIEEFFSSDIESVYSDQYDHDGSFEEAVENSFSRLQN